VHNKDFALDFSASLLCRQLETATQLNAARLENGWLTVLAALFGSRSKKRKKSQEENDEAGRLLLGASVDDDCVFVDADKINKHCDLLQQSWLCWW